MLRTEKTCLLLIKPQGFSVLIVCVPRCVSRWLFSEPKEFLTQQEEGSENSALLSRVASCLLVLPVFQVYTRNSRCSPPSSLGEWGNRLEDLEDSALGLLTGAHAATRCVAPARRTQSTDIQPCLHLPQGGPLKATWQAIHPERERQHLPWGTRERVPFPLFLISTELPSGLTLAEASSEWSQGKVGAEVFFIAGLGQVL